MKPEAHGPDTLIPTPLETRDTSPPDPEHDVSGRDRCGFSAHNISSLPKVKTMI